LFETKLVLASKGAESPALQPCPHMPSIQLPAMVLGKGEGEPRKGDSWKEGAKHHPCQQQRHPGLTAETHPSPVTLTLMS